MKYCTSIILVLMLLSESEGCWSSKSKKVASTTPPPPTTTTTAATLVAKRVDETFARGPTESITTRNLKKFSEELVKADTNSVGNQISVNPQKKTKSSDIGDFAPQPLISPFGPELLKGGTFGPFSALLDNYVPEVNIVENNSKQELIEQDSFLKAVMATNVMKKLETFLKKNHFIQGSLQPILKTIWFTPYSRSRGRLGSSGFEHVFAGELKNRKVSGLHNWVYFSKVEDKNELNYLGYIKRIDLGNKGMVLKMRFNWLDHPKDFGSMFIGTSPELEMALYTLCFYTRQNKGCSLQLNGHPVRVKVFAQSYRNKKLIGSAYPDIY